MPTVPSLSPEQMQIQQASGSPGGISPAMFLVAAAQMHNEGSLASPSGDKTSPLPAKPMRANKKLKLIR